MPNSGGFLASRRQLRLHLEGLSGALGARLGPLGLPSDADCGRRPSGMGLLAGDDLVPCTAAMGLGCQRTHLVTPPPLSWAFIVCDFVVLVVLEPPLTVPRLACDPALAARDCFNSVPTKGNCSRVHRSLAQCLTVSSFAIR
jgi:hypothetical protein